MANKNGSRRKGQRMLVIKKRSAQEWLKDDNLAVLRGIAITCLTYADLAACIDVTQETLINWRKKYPEIREAIEYGRTEADAHIINYTFDQAMNGNEAAIERWWRYRLSIAKSADDDENETERVVIIDDLRKARQSVDKDADTD